MKFSLWTQNGALNSKPIFDAFRQNSKLDTIEDSIQILLLLVSLYKDGIIDKNSITTISDVTDLKLLIQKEFLL
jgi:hypothetical protein